MLDRDLTLKNNELFLVGREEDRGGMHEAGLYLRDTRFLSQFAVTIAGTPLEALAVQTPSTAEALITATVVPEGDPARDLPEEHAASSIPTSGLAIRQRVTLETALTVTIEVRRYGPWVGQTELEVHLAADFRDMFDVRGMTPDRRPTLAAPEIADARVTFSATGGDGETARLDVTAAPAIDRTGYAPEAPEDGVTLIFPLNLTATDRQTVELTLRPVPVGVPHVADPVGADGPAGDLRLTVDAAGDRAPAGDLAEMCHRADLDLAMLQTTFPEGSMPAAGTPWYVAPFGRDSLIVALQTLHLYPERAWGTLRVLAAEQGSELNDWTEEEPGKILHETRYGDMARTRQIPHTPYFGSIDSTPLFVMTFAEAARRQPDAPEIEVLLPNVRRAIEWIDAYGDLDGDGLVEFGDKAEDGVHISQQGWKDSGDSLHWAGGREVQGPFALVEVQGYVYAAHAWLADVVETRGDAAWAADLRAAAERVRVTVEERYWLPEAGFYAQALDGDKRAVDAISSNPGHLLFCGLPSPERAAQVVERLMRPDMLTPWGIRTLSSEMTTFNPMSYHNGSVWPHDTSIAMWGMVHYGHHEAAAEVARALVRLSTHDPERRLSELYCGFDADDPRLGPVDYPVSCRPQAWAAGCAHLVARILAPGTDNL